MMSEPTTLPTPQVVPEQEQQVRRQPPYNVILLNDDDHTYEYVIRMLKEIFAFPEEKGYRMADEVHRSGRVIVLTTTLEHAELKRDQIHAYGPDPLLERCKGSMSAMIEPAMD
jgi:ATP-dependent Clp protease adaptor protein ClpS